MPKKPKPTETRRLLDRLLAARTVFDSKSANRKRILVEKLSAAEFRNAEALISYHDALSFLRAYPENKSLVERVEAEFKRFGKRLEVYREKGGDPAGVRLVNSGISHSEVHHIFSHEMARKLSTWYPRQIEIGWDSIDSEPVEAIAGLLPLLVCWQENDLLDNATNFDVRQWLTDAAGKSGRTTLAVLLDILAASDLPERIQHLLYESIELRLHWLLDDSEASRTFNRVACARLYTQSGPLRPRSKSLLREMRKPAAKLQLLSPKHGEQSVRKISEVLAVRFRELYPLTNANPAEVYLCEPGRGLQMYIYGSLPSARLPLEANFGAMFVRNGLPVGYGVAVVLFDRVEIAVNVFPAFRTGESAFLIEQFFRVFYHYFGSRLFLVQKGQMGYGDDEPLKSGAFWFYYKLGFRALDAGVRDLAELEHQKILKQKKYRCSLATLKKLSKSDVVLCADGSIAADYQDLSLIGLAKVVTSMANTRHDGSRRKTNDESVRKLQRVLSIGSLSGWSDDQRVALERLAPLLISIPDLSKWSSASRAKLARIVRAKGSVREREFVQLCNRHPQLKAALAEMASAHSQTSAG